MMKVCNRYKTPMVFEQFVYKLVMWSGDHLPYCPICNMSPYDEDYEDTHSIISNKGVEHEQI